MVSEITNQLLPNVEQLERVPAEEIPAVLAQLWSLQSVLYARLLAGGQGANPGPPPIENEPLMTSEQAAEFLAIKQSKVEEMARNGELPCVKLGRYVRFRKAALVKWLAEQETPVDRRKYVTYS